MLPYEGRPPWLIRAAPTSKAAVRPMGKTERAAMSGQAASTAMPITRFARITLAMLSLAGCLAFIGAAIEQAQAQFVNPAPPPQAPVFNPSSPNTVPQPPPTPVPPGLPMRGPGSETLTPNIEISPSVDTQPQRTQPQRQAATARTAPVHVATVHRRRHHRGTGYASNGPVEDYHPPRGYTGPYTACAWHRSWDGYWAPACY